MGDDEANTEMGVAPDAPTEYRQSVPIDTREAWSEDDTIEPDAAGASWTRVAAIAAAIALGASAVVGGVIAWDNRGHPPAEQGAVAAAEPEAPATPPAPPWHLDGTYRYDIRNPEGIVRDAYGQVADDMSTYAVPTATNWVAFKTTCDTSGCTARSVQLDDGTQQVPGVDRFGKTITTIFRWNGSSWLSADNVGPHSGRIVDIGCDDPPGPDTFEVWTVLTPQPQGGFEGTSYREDTTDACGTASGDRFEVPVGVVRTGSTPPEIFGS